MISFAGFFTAGNINLLVKGVCFTLLLTAASWILAAIVGTILSIIQEGGKQWARRCVAAYVAYQRNIPTLVHMLLWYFGVPALLPQGLQSWVNANNGEFILASIALGLCLGAYFCEDIRSGFRSISYGQHEAARAVGLNYLQGMRYVVLPQALRIALPALVNHSVMLFKSTSLAMALGAAELTYVVREIENETFRTFDAYFVATIVYLAISLGLMAIGETIERRYRVVPR
ncbi:polar amino acid ABC transporter inner membrane subunit [Burkholderia lata]|uniref:Polar amino acid ABC transporter inner membrane subunit n=1 Tax=Burkholderia lata (strain ATCC 17760 / DSM 23089 / LMG 22485 / NCIMB 9086 / R18194 / 383) TaxID=482957 RepID=A0A6P2UZX9_BURL3|nr:amino acid ABC transporter permease [Burkholderia lata]VWC76334.1 polar amino acid ABC transporter inner membrane subunit [Burkholderia lata]